MITLYSPKTAELCRAVPISVSLESVKKLTLSNSWITSQCKSDLRNYQSDLHNSQNDLHTSQKLICVTPQSG